MAMNIDFTGKTVLVTGGGRGLGKEMALQFAGCGANVYIANRKEDQGLATVKEIEALGVKGGFTKCDVAVEEDVKKLIADAAAFGGGKIDVIVNAAGVISLQDMMHTTTEEVQRLFNINVVGTVHMIKHGLAHREANKGGNMILVSSIAGRDGMGMLQTYSASKAAVTSLMQSAAKHAAPYGVRVNAILPGIIRTAMWEEILEGGLAPNATVMSWRGIEGGIEAVKHKHDAIMTPSSFLYFDYYQTMDTDNEPPAIGGYVPLEKVYSYEPVPQILTPEEAKHIVGIQANLWTEYIPTYSQVEYMELPRMAALSEIQWTMPKKKEYADFLKRLPGLIAVYDINQYNYAKHIFQVKSQYIPDTEANVLNVVLSTIDNTPVYYTLDGSEPTASSNIYTDTLKIGQSCTLKAITIRPNGSSAVLKEDIKFNKATMKPITMQQPINEKYKFEGKNTLIDGLAGSRNYRTGRWIAFYQNDLEAVIDLQQETPISKAWVRTYVEIGEEILDLRELSVAVSNDGKEYKEVKSEVYPAVSKEDKNGIYTHELSFDTVQARYVKIAARPEYNIPAWHWGKGRPAFIFVDEIGLE